MQAARKSGVWFSMASYRLSREGRGIVPVHINFNFTFDFDGAAVRFEAARNPAPALPRLAGQEVSDLAGE